MKLLFDENLSRRLVARLIDPLTLHVKGLLRSADIAVWEHAKLQGFTIVTADADYYELSISFGPPPKVIWLRGCDYPTAVAEKLIRSQAVRIAEFLQDEDEGVLILAP